MPFLSFWHDRLSSNLKAALLTLFGVSAFVVNDSLTRVAGNTLPVSQVMLLRGLFASLTLFIWLRTKGPLPPIRAMLDLRLLARNILDGTATILFLMALAKMPLANVFAILQGIPLAVTAAAAILLREPVGWRRWGAIGIGFLGVLICLRPGPDGFSIYAICLLLSVICSALREIVTRTIRPELPSSVVSFVTSIAVGLFGLLILPFETRSWQTPGWAELLALFFAGVFVILGLISTTAAIRGGDVSFAAPFRYGNLIVAILIGWLFFAELPDALTLIGSAIIVGSGLFTLYRERVRKDAQPIAAENMARGAPRGI
ncbi:DMT family transporter [Notoacmeibacter ruber]|uniref:DMT family transporter n=1 Tax=Notoacmeibacter ruber TaxID=2670375 RepID=A0A3L7JCN5_9HYPH|nr:DMT family transporter [Notoacmeibacter ruber]RLQ88099.1 DMT family transporter [Notoacmeibacter ruber]